MSSYFYSTKTGSKRTYPLPDYLDIDGVLAILHDHSLLSQIFWPHSSASVWPQPSTASNTTNLVVHQNNLENKASICSQPNGVVSIEELPLGLKATITYAVASRDHLAEEQRAHSEKEEAVSNSSLLDFSTAPLDHQLYLVEERSATAFKPMASFIKMNDSQLPRRTENLLKVLESFGGPQKDIMSALAELNGMRTHVDPDVSGEKAKDE